MDGKHSVMAKLRQLHESGRLKDLIRELRHYLGKLDHKVKSPLMIELLDMFKAVITKDLSEVNENLSVLEQLFNAPGLDLKSELADIFFSLTDISQLKHVLFSRYFALIKKGFPSLDGETRGFVIEVLTSVARGVPDLQVETAIYFLSVVPTSSDDVLVDLLQGVNVLLDDNPALDTLFEAHVEMLVERYFMTSDDQAGLAFLSLFKKLLRFSTAIMDPVIKAFRQPDSLMKSKALGVMPALLGCGMDLQCFEVLMGAPCTVDCEVQAGIVEIVAAIASKNLEYYLPRILHRWVQSRDQAEENAFLDVINLLASRDFPFLFRKLFNATRVVDGVPDERMLGALKNVEFDHPRQFDAYLFKTFEEFPALHEGSRLVVLDKMHAIVKAMGKDILLVWFGKALEEFSRDPPGSNGELTQRARELLGDLKASRPGLDEEMGVVRAKIQSIQDTITTMKNYPKLLREKIETLSDVHSREQRLKLMEREYTLFVNKIMKFELFLNKIDFRHFILDLVDEWYSAKEYILDDLNIVKDYLEGRVAEDHASLQAEVASVVPRLKAKLDMLRIQFDEAEARGAVDLDGPGRDAHVEQLLNLEFDAVMLDIELGTLRTRYMLGDAVLGEFSREWDTVHASITRFLKERTGAINAWYDEMAAAKDAYSSLQGFLVTYIHETMKQCEQRLASITGIVDMSFNSRLGDLHQAARALVFNYHKTLDMIEEKVHDIEKSWRKVSQETRDIEAIIGIKHAKNEWDTFVANYRETLSRLYQERMELIDAEQLGHMLQLVAPLSLEYLKETLHSIEYSNDVDYLDKIVRLIQKYNIDARLDGTNVINAEAYMSGLRSHDIMRLSTRIVVNGDILVLMVSLENTDVHDLTDIIVTCDRIDALARESRIVYKETIPVLETGHESIVSWEIDVPLSNLGGVDVVSSSQPRPVEFIINAKGIRAGTPFKRREKLYLLSK